ncbi:uncharacterized protein LOC115627952 [Scaptodrosophila lebanonensis]|uniref:Uncharacterized protein LOC115627952 n=1 Tax=Drosophila lebanonensis TaxID=7225 RepID=A0A6J2TSZ8_DROLE|nr:uncharacterized protein LOC115627952 [Scaptodrosophila lebanonensis]
MKMPKLKLKTVAWVDGWPLAAMVDVGIVCVQLHGSDNVIGVLDQPQKLLLLLYVHTYIYTSRRLPCFSISSIQEKVKEGQHPLSHSYKRYKQPGGAIAGHTVAVSQTRRQQQHQQQEHQQEQQHGRHAGLRTGPANGRLHQVHDVSANVGLAQTPPTGYACRKHPNLLGPGDGSNLNLYLHNDLERRFYFEKPAVSKCNLHSRSFAKSLNELCTEMTPPAVPPPPPPSAVRMSVGAANAKLSQQTFADLPQEFPLTRSVSTTTDIYTSAPPQQQQLERRSRRNMATNTVIRYSRDMDIDEDATEEQARRLCGLKRGIRKTKDELFQEFCKRAGVRSKPKNIYYIASDEATFPSQQTRSRRSVGSRNEDEHIDYDHEDDDADGDEHGFKRFRSGAPIEEEQLYLPGDRQQATQFPRGLAPPAASSSHQHRRASMCVDPPSQLPPVGHLRKLNSNLSLHMPLHADRQSLYDLDRCDSTSFDVWPGTHFGGSQSRLPQDYGVPAPALAPTQSRTLPRCFLRQPATGMGVAGSQESFGSLQSNFSASQQRFSQLMMQHQQQLQQQNRFLSTLTLHKPAEEQAAVHWPAAIPSSPSNYRSSGYQVYAPAVSGIGGGTALHPPPAKFQRAYAFDDQQRRPSFAINDAFDLDEIERERRRSHASLFGSATTQEQYDLINGTAV